MLYYWLLLIIQNFSIMEAKVWSRPQLLDFSWKWVTMSHLTWWAAGKCFLCFCWSWIFECWIRPPTLTRLLTNIGANGQMLLNFERDLPEFKLWCSSLKWSVWTKPNIVFLLLYNIPAFKINKTLSFGLFFFVFHFLIISLMHAKCLTIFCHDD